MMPGQPGTPLRQQLGEADGLDHGHDVAPGHEMPRHLGQAAGTERHIERAVERLSMACEG